MYQALYRKWRPKTFSDVVGQEHITTTLRRQVAEGRLSHAYLFTGTRGTGKTTCAKILAKAVNCEHPVGGDPCNCCKSCLGIDAGTLLDVVELDAASNNGVDNVRALRDEAIYSPAQVKMRVYIIDEVHMLSTPAFNALLKILEEPPAHLMFILATTELHKVLPTILSRCQRFAFRRIPPEDIQARLAYVAQQESIDLRPDGAELLARMSGGALRDALSLLDQCAAAGGAITAAAVLETLGLAGNVQTAELMELVLRHDAAGALELLGQLYARGKDMGAVLGELATLCRDLLISVTAPKGGAALLSGGFDAGTLDRLRTQAGPARLIHICTLLQSAVAAMQNSVSPRTDAELCLLRLCDESLSGDLTALSARIERLERQLAAGVPVAAAPAPVTPIAPPKAEPAPAPVPLRAVVSPPAEDTPPWNEPPAEDDGPPPYGEAVAPQRSAPAPEPPRAEPAPSPAPEAPAGEDDVFARLMEQYKNRLSVDKRAFIGMVSGRVQDNVLTVYCPTEMQKVMLDTDSVKRVLEEVTSRALGRDVRVRFTVGKAPGDGPHDKMQDLLRMGSKFDHFTVK